MIVFAPSGEASSSAESWFKVEQGETIAICQTVATENQPGTELSEFNFNTAIGSKLELDHYPIEVKENFNWSDPKVNHQFIELEQKVLANKAAKDEMKHYQAMKNDRDGIIFSDRYISDYAEIQRLKILSEKIAEIQKFLRPISLG